jgi:hypothetical protein
MLEVYWDGERLLTPTCRRINPDADQDSTRRRAAPPGSRLPGLSSIPCALEPGERICANIHRIPTAKETTLFAKDGSDSSCRSDQESSTGCDPSVRCQDRSIKIEQALLNSAWLHERLSLPIIQPIQENDMTTFQPSCL